MKTIVIASFYTLMITLNVHGQTQNHQVDDKFFENLKSAKDKCNSIFEITSDSLLYFNKRKISKNRIYPIVKKLYKKCKSKSKVAFIADWGGNYNFPFDFVGYDDLALKAITDIHEEYSIKKFGKSADSIPYDEWENIVETYPLTVYAYWCCKE